MKTLHVYSLSGGQDSTAMLVHALETGHPVDYIIFCDTGNEFDEMYAYLNRLDIWLKNKYGKSITRLGGKHTLKSLCFSPFTRGKRKGQIRGLPYASSMSFCTRELKKNISDNFCTSLAKKEDALIYLYLGYVAREKNRIHENERLYIQNRFPLIERGWNEPEVSNFIQSMGLFNPLYKNFTRTGCKYCPKQSLESWYALYCIDPVSFDEAIAWEKEAKEANAHIKNFRSDYSLPDLKKRFKKRKAKEDAQPTFPIDWNEEQVSCFCK